MASSCCSIIFHNSFTKSIKPRKPWPARLAFSSKNLCVVRKTNASEQWLRRTWFMNRLSELTDYLGSIRPVLLRPDNPKLNAIFLQGKAL